MRAARLLQPPPLHLRHALDQAPLAAAREALRAEVPLGALGHHFALFYQPVARLRVWLRLLRELEGEFRARLADLGANDEV